MLHCFVSIPLFSIISPLLLFIAENGNIWLGFLLAKKKIFITMNISVSFNITSVYNLYNSSICYYAKKVFINVASDTYCVYFLIVCICVYKRGVNSVFQLQLSFYDFYA